MKRTRCSFSTLALVLACGGGGDDGDGELSRDDAAALVIEQFVTDGDPVVVLGMADPLAAGDRIVAYHPEPGLETEVAIEAETESWFFWVDDEPRARFDHPSRFVIVDRESGEIMTMDARWWPTLDGVAVWDDAAYRSEADWVYADTGDVSSRAGLVPELVPLGDCTTGGGHAVVINGVLPGEIGAGDFAQDGANMSEALTDAGLDTTYFGPAGAEGVEEPLSNAALENWFAEKAAELSAGDTLVVYISAHGWVSESGRPGETQLGDVWETDLEEWLAKFDPGVNVVVMLDGCHSGGMLDSLSCVSDLTVTATDEEHSSYGDLDVGDPNPADSGGEWTSSMLTCWNTLMESEETRTALGERAQAASANFFTQLIGECFAGAAEHDEAQQRGLTFPQQQKGAAKAAIPQVDPNPPMCEPGETSCTEEELAAVSQMLGFVLTAEPGEVCEFLIALGLGNETTLSTGNDEQTAEGNVDGAHAFLGADLSLAEPLACGAEVVCSNPNTPPDPKSVFVAGLWLDGPIDQMPEHHYQYGFVFDQDGDTSNNYQAAEPYPADFFDDTDLWIQLLGVPGQPWTLEVVDARDGKLVSLQTQAAVVIDGDMLLAILPSDLVAGATDMRFTAFRHEGDYGAAMPWSGDVMPPIDEPKIPMPE
jgi:hypothetical protein